MDLHGLSHKQPHPEFELASACLFAKTITFTTSVYKQATNITLFSLLFEFGFVSFRLVLRHINHYKLFYAKSILVPPFRVRVDLVRVNLGTMAKEKYEVFAKAPAFLESHHQIV